MSLAAIEDKWYRKAMAGFKANWARMVKRAAAFDEFCEGISAVTGIPKGTVAASLPARNYKEFQAEADKYLQIAVRKIESAHRQGKWSAKYKAAFQG